MLTLELKRGDKGICATIILIFTMSSITANMIIIGKKYHNRYDYHNYCPTLVYGSRNLLWEKFFGDETQRAFKMSFFANFKGDGVWLCS